MTFWRFGRKIWTVLDSLVLFNSTVGLVLVVVTFVMLVRAGRARDRIDRSFESIIDPPVQADYRSVSITLFFTLGWALSSSTCGWANSVAKGVLLNECRAEAEEKESESETMAPAEESVDP